MLTTAHHTLSLQCWLQSHTHKRRGPLAAHTPSQPASLHACVKLSTGITHYKQRSVAQGPHTSCTARQLASLFNRLGACRRRFKSSDRRVHRSARHNADRERQRPAPGAPAKETARRLAESIRIHKVHQIVAHCASVSALLFPCACSCSSPRLCRPPFTSAGRSCRLVGWLSRPRGVRAAGTSARHAPHPAGSLFLLFMQ